MKRVRTNVQNGWLRRSGWMGRWLTVYLHRYGGVKEATGRFHNHPWRLAISVVIKGGYEDDVLVDVKERRAFSLHLYRKWRQHRILGVEKGTTTLFVGICRIQRRGRSYTEKTRYGYAHYSELRDVPSARTSWETVS